MRASLRLAPGRAEGIASRTLRADRLYEGAGGFALRIDPADQFQRAMLLGGFDPWLEDVITRLIKAGDVVIECGTFIGFVTLRLARQVGDEGEVHAFEADPRVVGRVREHLDANGASQVRLNHAAVHESDGEIELRLTDQLGWATIQDMWDAADGIVAVPAVSIDSYVERERIDPARISFIKVDVEGAEPAALRGAANTLRATSAAVLVEIIPWRLELAGSSEKAIYDFMESCGYVREHVAPEDVLFTKRGPPRHS